MSVIQITTKRFREKLASFFDLADRGERVIVERGKGRRYMITPIQEGDMIISPELERKIEAGLNESQTGNVVRVNSSEDLHDFLENL